MEILKSESQEVLKQLLAGSGENRFGVELYAFEFVAAMAEAHDDAIVSLRGDGKFAWKRFAFDDERVIARGNKGLGQFAEDTFAVVMDFAGFAVKEFGRADDISAERLANRLVP